MDNACRDIASAAEAMRGMDESECCLVKNVIEKMVVLSVNSLEHVVQDAFSSDNNQTG